MKATSLAIGMVMLAVVTAGCGTTPQQGAGDREYTPPTSIHNILDSTALVYSDPAAGSAVNDNPYRWLGFILHPVGQALDYGVRYSGCTVHFVDEGVDTGPIILQAVVKVKDDDTEETLSKRILAKEHVIYAEAVKLFAQGRIKIIGRKTRIS